MQDRFGLGISVDAADDDDRGLEAGRADGFADFGRRLEIAPEGSVFIGDMAGDAFVAAGAGIGVGGLTDAWLLGVLETPAARQGKKIHAGAGEFGSVITGILDLGAPCYAVFGKEAAADRVVRANLLADPREDLQRQTHPCLAVAAVTICAVVGGRQERGHRVGMGVVQLDAVDAGFPGPAGGLREQLGQGLGQAGDVREMGVGDTFPLAHAQGIELAVGKNVCEGLLRQSGQMRADFVLRPVLGAQFQAVPVGDFEEAGKILFRLGAATHGEKIKALDKQPCVAFAGLLHGLGELLQSRNEAVVADAEKGPRGHIADTRRLDDQPAGPAARQALVPVEHVIGDHAVDARPPRHHCRHPAPRLKFERANAHRAEQPGFRGLRRTRPVPRLGRVYDPLWGFPHRPPTLHASEFISSIK